MTTWEIGVTVRTSLATAGMINEEVLALVRKVRRVGAAICLAVGVLAGPGPAGASSQNDFPTVARADYVFACMASNGQTQEMLYKCSCSIDAIAELMSYDQYVQAETIIRLRGIPGEKTAPMRDTPWTQEVIDLMRRSQAEAELKCF